MTLLFTLHLQSEALTERVYTEVAIEAETEVEAKAEAEAGAEAEAKAKAEAASEAETKISCGLMSSFSSFFSKI